MKNIIRIPVWTMVFVEVMLLLLVPVAMWCEEYHAAQWAMRLVEPTLPWLAGVIGLITAYAIFLTFFRTGELLTRTYAQRIYRKRAFYKEEAELWRIAAYELRNHRREKMAQQAEMKSKRCRRLASARYAEKLQARVIRFAKSGDIIANLGRGIMNLLCD